MRKSVLIVTNIIQAALLIFACGAAGNTEDMSSNLTESTTWITPVSFPDPGDALTAAPVRQAMTDALDRTNVLREVSPYHTTPKNIYTQFTPIYLEPTDSYTVSLGSKIIITFSGAPTISRGFLLPLFNDHAGISADGTRYLTSLVFTAGGSNPAVDVVVNTADGASLMSGTIPALSTSYTLNFPALTQMSTIGGFLISLAPAAGGSMNTAVHIVTTGATAP